MLTYNGGKLYVVVDTLLNAFVFALHNLFETF